MSLTFKKVAVPQQKTISDEWIPYFKVFIKSEVFSSAIALLGLPAWMMNEKNVSLSSLENQYGIEFHSTLLDQSIKTWLSLCHSLNFIVTSSDNSVKLWGVTNQIGQEVLFLMIPNTFHNYQNETPSVPKWKIECAGTFASFSSIFKQKKIDKAKLRLLGFNDLPDLQWPFGTNNDEIPLFQCWKFKHWLKISQRACNAMTYPNLQVAKYFPKQKSMMSPVPHWLVSVENGNEGVLDHMMVLRGKDIVDIIPKSKAIAYATSYIALLSPERREEFKWLAEDTKICSGCDHGDVGGCQWEGGEYDGTSTRNHYDSGESVSSMEYMSCAMGTTCDDEQYRMYSKCDSRCNIKIVPFDWELMARVTYLLNYYSGI